jgi:hypothetical protein
VSPVRQEATPSELRKGEQPPIVDRTTDRDEMDRARGVEHLGFGLPTRPGRERPKIVGAVGVERWCNTGFE